MLQEFDVNLEVTEIFSLMKNPGCSPDKAQLNTFGNINTTEVLKHFQSGEFKARLKFIKLTGSILFI